MNNNPRIGLKDSLQDAILKLAEGNPGALNVLLSFCTQNSSIDPDDAFGGFGPILSLDSHGIYGSRIWMLYKDVCGCDVAKALALLRAVQMGVIAEGKLHSAIDGVERLNVNDVVTRLKKKLPNFKV